MGSQQDVTVDTLESGRIVVTNPFSGRDQTEVSAWRLVEELRLGRFEGNGPDVFGDINTITVDDNGRIYVLDVGWKEVRVFDRNGRHLRNVVRDGDGPGERPYQPGLRWNLVWQPPNRLWVSDRMRELAVDSLGNELHRVPWSFPFVTEGEFSKRSVIVGADSLGHIYKELSVYARRTFDEMEYPRLTYVVRIPYRIVTRC